MKLFNTNYFTHWEKREIDSAQKRALMLFDEENLLFNKNNIVESAILLRATKIIFNSPDIKQQENYGSVY